MVALIQRRLLVPALLALLGALLLAAPLQADATAATGAAAGITLQAEAGYGGYGRLGHLLPIQVDLTNTGPEMTADLVVSEPPTPGFANGKGGAPLYQTAYHMTVHLPHNAHKRVLMYLPVQAIAGSVSVAVEHNGIEIVGSDATFTPIGDRQLLVGVVANPPLTLPWLRQMALPAVGGNGTTVDVAGLAPSQLPATPDELAAFDVLLFEHSTALQLSDAQRVALQGWVGRGGLLMLPGGSGWDTLAAALPADLLPLNHPAMRNVAGLPELGNFAGVPLTDGGPMLLTTGTLRAQPLVMQDGIPLLAHLPYGSGQVLFSAADFATEPLLHWPGEAALWQHLLVLELPPGILLAPPQPNLAGVEPYQNLANVMGNVPVAVPPVWRLLGGLLVGYVLLAAPLGYLLLRRIGRPVLYWLLVPALAVAFAAVTDGLAFRDRGSEAIINTVTVSEFPAGASVGRLLSFVGVFAPAEQRYQVQFATPVLLAGLPSPFSRRYTGGPAPAVKVGEVIREDQAQVDLLPTGQWTLRGVRGERWSAGGSGIVSHVTLEAGAVSGTVTNRSGRTLDDCAISTALGTQLLGTLAPGASADFRLDRSTGAAFVGQMFSSPLASGGPVPAQSRLAQIRQQILFSLWSAPGFLGLNNPQVGPLLFMGWTAPGGEAPRVNGRAVRQSGLGLVVAGLPLDTAHAAAVPPGLLPARLWSADANSAAQGSVLTIGGGSLTLAAELPPATAPRSVTVEASLPGGFATSAVTVSFYNRLSDAFDAATSVTVTRFSPPTPTPAVSRTSPSTPTPAARGKAVPTPTAGGLRLLPVPPGMTAPMKILSNRLDATLGPADLGAYLNLDGTVRFRLSVRQGAVTLLAPVSYGYTLSGAGQ